MDIKGKLYTRTNGSGVHYARIILPKELRAFMAKAAIWRSLATKEDTEARHAGIVTALASRTVFQEVAVTLLDNATVVIDTDIVGEKIDLDAIVNTINGEETERVAASLRQAFGLTSTEPPVGNSQGSNGSPTDSTSGSTRAVKPSKKKTAAGEASTEDQIEAAPQLSDDVAEYIELRPHGYYRLRFWIPRSLHGVLGQREVRCTLKTKDRREAIFKATPLVRELRQKLQRLQGVSISA